MADISDLWQRLEAWGAEHSPKMLEDLNPAASDDDIAELERVIGLTLPDDYRESLKTHNGEHDGWPSKVFADMGAYLPCDQVIGNWQMRVQIAEQIGLEFSDEQRAQQISDGIIFVDDPVRPDTFNQAWVPIMDCNGDVVWAIDFAPAQSGVPGQIIQVDLEGCEWRVVASSFKEFLEHYVTSLEAGEFPIHEGLPTREAL